MDSTSITKGDSQDDTNVAAGRIGENEFYKSVVLDSNWTLEPHRPDPDNEQVDFLLHPQGDPLNLLLFQVKVAFHLRRPRRSRARYLEIRFPLKASRLFVHPRYFFFFGGIDPDRRTFVDPVFLAPSAAVASIARSYGKDRLDVSLQASMEEGSKDMWVPYRTSCYGIAGRLQQLFDSLPRLTETDASALSRLVGRRRAA